MKTLVLITVRSMAVVTIGMAGVVGLAGCNTIMPGQESAREGVRAEREEQGKLREQRRIAREDERMAVESARRAHEKQREEAKQLREKYERYTTAELKLMHQRYLELASGAGGRDLNVRLNSWLPSESDKKQMERVVEIERELLRRWKAGDAEARLPNFEQSQPASESK
jgi:flagellar motility protein MotE (MotC chaperone)